MEAYRKTKRPRKGSEEEGQEILILTLDVENYKVSATNHQADLASPLGPRRETAVGGGKSNATSRDSYPAGGR